MEMDACVNSDRVRTRRKWGEGRHTQMHAFSKCARSHTRQAHTSTHTHTHKNTHTHMSKHARDTQRKEKEEREERRRAEARDWPVGISEESRSPHADAAPTSSKEPVD